MAGRWRVLYLQDNTEASSMVSPWFVPPSTCQLGSQQLPLLVQHSCTQLLRKSFTLSGGKVEPAAASFRQRRKKFC
eukprot:1158955-Pelagomonas_calceolata.AAC.7